MSTPMRCPGDDAHPVGKLFAVLRSDVTPSLYEVSCHNCRRNGNRDSSSPHIEMVLHRFDATGQLVETEIVYAEALS